MYKISKISIDKIPARKFPEIKLKKDGKMEKVSRKETKKTVGGWSFGGISEEQLEEKAKKAELKGVQYYKRKKIMKLVAEKEKARPEQKIQPEFIPEEPEIDVKSEEQEISADEWLDKAA